MCVLLSSGVGKIIPCAAFVSQQRKLWGNMETVPPRWNLLRLVRNDTAGKGDRTMKAKRALGAIISTIMLLSMFAVPSYAVGTFTDVAEDAYYVKAVTWAIDNNIASGTTSTTFSPDQICTKAEIITFLWRSKGCPEPTQISTSFPDLDGTEYYFKAAQWAFENGLVTSNNVPFNADTLCTSILFSN